MRKLLLAGVAALGASAGLANYASAQVAVVTEDPKAPQPAATLYERKTAYPGVGTYAPPAIKQATPEPGPGQMIIRMGGTVAVYQQYSQQGDATVPTGNGGTNKLANWDFGSYARLYPSLEGRATNGLKYGAFMEIRQDYNSGAGGGVYGSVSGSVQRRSGLYFRREYGYFGTDQMGIIRVGSGDQPTSLFITGNMENFNDGGWNGDLPGLLANALIIAWPFEDTGNLYTTQKVVYLSPQLAGFDFGISYEPNTGSESDQNGCGSLPFYTGGTAPAGGNGATAGCNALSSTGVAGELSRRRNTFDGVLRYRGAFGPFGVAATGGFIFSGQVQNNTPAASQTAGTVYNYDGLSVGDFGLATTWGGLTVGGHVTFGRWNPYNGYNLPVANTSNGMAYIAGASYQPAPNFIFGAHYLADWGAGAQTYLNSKTVGDRHEQGLAFGATYTVTPGFNFYLSGLWGTRKENGYNFVTGSGSSSGAVGSGLNALDHNKVSTFALAIGENFHW